MEYLVFLASRILNDARFVSVEPLLLLLEEREVLDHLQRELQVDQQFGEAVEVVLLDELFDLADAFLEPLDVLTHLVATCDLLVELEQLLQVVSRLLRAHPLCVSASTLVKSRADLLDALTRFSWISPSSSLSLLNDQELVCRFQYLGRALG